MDSNKRIKKLPYFIALALIIGIALFLLRGPHLSNALKKIVLPELERVTGKNIIAKKLYINVFPLYIGAKRIKVFDENGERILYAQRAKAYIELSGLFSKNILVRRLVVKEPDITVKKKQLDELVEHIKETAVKESESSFTVKVIAVEVKEGHVNLDDENTRSISDFADINGEILLGDSQRIKASAEKILIKKQGWPDLTGSVQTVFIVKDEAVQIDSLVIHTLGSEITGSGEYKGNSGRLTAEAEFLVSTVKHIFKLDQSGEGKLHASGDVTYGNKGLNVDLKVEGNLYLETLMELLKVKERVEGFVNVKGEIKGPLSDIKGTGTATMRNGNLFDVDIDSLQCTVAYADGKMKFIDGDARLYNGRARASGSIQLPVVNFFTLDIDFSDIDSKSLFHLIGWDPGFEPGKVEGYLTHAAVQFSPQGWFEYKNTEKGRDALGRVSDITGRYEMHDSLLTLTDLKLSTGKSDLIISGLVDIEHETLEFGGILTMSNVVDISAPYYEKLEGTGEFAVTIEGSFAQPVINGTLKLYDTYIEGYRSGAVVADISYNKDALNIKKLTLRHEKQIHELDGNIYFKKAENLFDFSEPEFKLNSTLKNADFKKLAEFYYPEFEGTGKLSANMKIGGTDKNPTISGTAVIEQATVYNVPVESASFGFKFTDKKFVFTQMNIKQGRSLLNADAVIDTDGAFSFYALSDELMLSNLIQKEIQGDVMFSIRAEGQGTFDNPSLVVDARMIRGSLKGKPLGSGVVHATLEQKKFVINASLINERLNIHAQGRLEDNYPWKAAVDIQTGRYDFLITSFLQEVPEDLILSLNGTVSLQGDKDTISGSSELKHVILSMYGYSFSNEEEILLKLHNRHLISNKISLRSGNTALKIKGSFALGEQYDLVIEGQSALSPFRSLSDKIGVLKGDAELVISIRGDWESPKISGGLSVSNGSFGLKEYYYRLSSLNGFLYIDEDRVVLHKLTGKVGGGDVELSGILYLKKFSFKRFYVEAELENITASISPDFDINFGGNLLYKGTPASQIVSGDIEIHRAHYSERVEWKSWLLKTKRKEKYKAEISDLEKAAFNVKVTSKDDILINNNVARAKVSADMLLKGTIYRPILFGRLESKEGTVFFRNNEFRILHASADFADPHQINPVMTIAADTIVKGYKIKMNLEGHLDHFNMALSSDPPLKEMDIFALLTVGQTSGDLKGLEGGIGASEATSFVTGKLQDVVEERLKTVTGLDRFQIDPHVSKTTGAVEPRVTVSKRLLGDKMFAAYTTTLGSAEEQIVKLEYFLNESISLIGVRDERGILGGDIRFRFQFK